MTFQPQPHVPAPGLMPPPRGPGLFIAGTLLALSTACSHPATVPPKDPAARALGFLRSAQGIDGAFRTRSLSEEVSTAFVLGLLSRSEAPAGDVDDLLGRAAAFLLSRQREDGSFGERLTSALCVMALSDYGRRLRRERAPDAPGVEIFDAALLPKGAGPRDEDRVLEGQGENGGWSGDPVETAFRLRVIRLRRPSGGPVA